MKYYRHVEYPEYYRVHEDGSYEWLWNYIEVSDNEASHIIPPQTWNKSPSGIIFDKTRASEITEEEMFLVFL